MQWNAPRHAGFVRDYETRSTTEIERAIASLSRRSRLHIHMAAHPEPHAPDWHTRNMKGQRGLVRFWLKEAVNYGEQAAMLRRLLKSMDTNDHRRELPTGDPAPAH